MATGNMAFFVTNSLFVFVVSELEVLIFRVGRVQLVDIHTYDLFGLTQRPIDVRHC